MHSLFDIYLEAINPPAGNYRAYSLSFGKDLLNNWIVQIQYGRIGTQGTIKNYSFNEFDNAVNLIRSILKKRLSSLKRIGCAYEIKNLYNKLGIRIGGKNDKIQHNECTELFL